MRIVIPGDPIPKARHRSYIRNKRITNYDTQTKELLAFRYKLTCLTLENDFVCNDKPVKVDLIFQLDSFKGSTKTEAILKQWGYTHPSKKPDLDNLEKFVLDAGNGILWSDDRFIVQLSSRKEFSKNPCTIINLEYIKDIKMSDEHEKVFKTFSPADCEQLSADAERIYMSIPVYQLADPKIYESQMAAAAQLLIDFANEWGDKLKKIKGKQ